MAQEKVFQVQSVFFCPVCVLQEDSSLVVLSLPIVEVQNITSNVSRPKLLQI